MSPSVDLHQLRIGYAPLDEELLAPMDRRRFLHYAARRGLSFEVAQSSGSYDLVVVSAGADISQWIRYPRGRAKIIYDFVDSYMLVPKRHMKDWLRGAAKFAVRQNRYPLLNYWKGQEDMCRRADAVICSTPEQRQNTLQYCPNVHLSLDFHTQVALHSKQNYAAGDVFNFVWEGVAGNLVFLKEIREVLEEIRKQRKIAIHAVTNLEYGRYLKGKFAVRSTLELAREVGSGIHLYAWNELMFSHIATACDLALIPVPLHDALCAAKPENKLLLFWRMGIPAVVSATPAYRRTMQQAGVDMACESAQDWRRVLAKYMNDESARREAGERGRAFVAREYSEERMLAIWDAALASVLEAK